MVDQEIIERVTRLPVIQRLELIEVLSHSLRSELLSLVPTAAQLADAATAEASRRRIAIERLAGSLKIQTPENSSLWRVLGLGQSSATPLTDEELKEDYINYLTEKYS